MTLKQIIRWPENKKRGIVPWFVILRRLIFTPFILIGGVFVVFGAFCGYGMLDAKRVFNDIFN